MVILAILHNIWYNRLKRWYILGRKCKDLTNRKFGSLLVIGLDNTSKQRRWICKCECGNPMEFSFESRYLMNGKHHHCGCLSKEQQPLIPKDKLYEMYVTNKQSISDISKSTGIHRNTISKYLKELKPTMAKTAPNTLSKEELYDLYVVKRHSVSKISRDYNISRNVIDTGIANDDLKYKRMTYPRNKKSNAHIGRKPSALLERKFGSLTVKKYLGSGKRVLCLCACNKEIEVNTSDLYSFNVTSCGCTQVSVGKLRIGKYLTRHNIKFSVDYECKSNLIFDFAIFNGDNLVYLIEFNEYEYESIIPKDIKKKNKLKEKYCRNNNIPLVKVKYKSNGRIYEILDREILPLLSVQ